MEEPTGASADNIGARARTAAGWQFLSKGINTALQMVTSIVLARLLMPADFGIVAMAAMVTGLAGIFQDLGLGQALVQRPEISEEHTRSAYWGTLVMACLLCAGIFFAAPHVGAFFDEPRMVIVLQISALGFVLSPFAVVPRSLLQRELDFKTPFFAALASSISSGAVGITMALLGYGYWALVFAGLAGGAMGTVALCILTRYLPPLIPTFRGIKDLYGFGVGITLTGLLNYASNRLDYFIVARRLSTDALGIYTKAFTLMRYVPDFVGSISGPILFPSFSQLQRSSERLSAAVIRSVATMAMLGWPFLALLGLLAPEVIPAILGDQWREAVVPTQILTPLGGMFIVGGVIGSYLKGIGQVYWLLLLQVVRAVFLLVGVWLGSSHGLVGAATGVLAGLTASFLIDLVVAEFHLRLRLKGWWLALRSPLLLTLITALVCAATKALVTGLGAGPLLTAAVATLAGLLGSGLLAYRAPLEEMGVAKDTAAQLAAVVLTARQR